MESDWGLELGSLASIDHWTELLGFSPCATVLNRAFAIHGPLNTSHVAEHQIACGKAGAQLPEESRNEAVPPRRPYTA
jgi:hypothetical protein